MSINNKASNQDSEETQTICWNKRTLPREIIKWIHGLDLSYSVKDPKKDLNNGFLIAEIFSRYYPKPGILNMHSFDNSQNFSRRKNNWELLDLFIKKQELPFARDDWRKILMDNDAEAIVAFMIKLYQFLTQRKISVPPLAQYVMNNQQGSIFSTVSEKQETTTYFLKDKGLEKLEDVKEKEQQQQAENQKPADVSSIQSEKKLQLSQVSSKRTNFLRVPSKPISQNVDSQNYHIDVKNVNVRQVKGSILELRETKMIKEDNERLGSVHGGTKFLNDKQKESTLGSKHQTQQQLSNSQYNSTNAQENKKKEKKLDSIMDVINTMLADSLRSKESESQKIKAKDNSLYQAFSDQIDVFEDEFIGNFFMDIQNAIESFLAYVQKDTNELWKFFNFLFICLNNLDPQKESLRVLVDLIKTFGQRAVQKDALKTKSIFVEFFLPQLAQYVKSCLLFEKKEMLFSIVYAFCPNEPLQRHQMICSLKFALNDQHLFMQALVVLIQYQTDFNANNQLLLNDFKHFIRMNILSSSTNLRTMSLALLNRLADLKYEMVLELIHPKLNAISQTTWWETKCLVIIVFSKIIKGIVNSEKYQSLVKNPAANQKFFSVETEKQIQDMKNQINELALGIQKAAYPAGSDYILKITFIYIVEHLKESKVLLELFLNLILTCSDEMRNFALYENNFEFDRSFVSKNNSQNYSYQVNQEPARSVEILNVNNAARNRNTNNNGNYQKDQVNLNQQHQQQQQFEDYYVYFVQSDKSLSYKHTINSAQIKQHASEILMTLVQMIENLDLNTNLITHEYMDLISYCFQHTDFKIINVESCEKIANILKEYVFLSLCDEELTVQTKDILLKLFELQFHSDVKIKESEHLFSSAISLIYENNFQKCIQQVEEILNILIEDYQTGVESVRRFLNEVYKGLFLRKNQSFKQNQNLMDILNPVVQHFKKENINLEQQYEEINGIEANEESAIKEENEREQGQDQEQSGIMEKDELSEILNAFQESDRDLFNRAQEWNLQSDFNLYLQKDQIVPVPEDLQDGLELNFNWTAGQKLDIDTAIVIMDKQGQVLDIINYMKLKSQDGAIFHKGDISEGANKKYDEQIQINLKIVNQNVHSLWVISNTQEKNAGNFSKLQEAQVNISQGDNVFCNFDWKNDVEPKYNGCIVGEFSKKNEVWTYKARGYYCQNCLKVENAVPIIQSVQKGDFSQVLR